jgi:hypothetical protein
MDCTLVGARSMPKGPKGQSASLMASNAMPPRRRLLGDAATHAVHVARGADASKP